MEDPKIFISVVRIGAAFVDDIIEERVQQCVYEKCFLQGKGKISTSHRPGCRRGGNKYASSRWNSQGLKIHARLLQNNWESKMWDLHVRKPYVGVLHVLKRLKLPQLYRKMMDCIDWKTAETFDTENSDRFMRDNISQAKTPQADLRVCSAYSNRKEIFTSEIPETKPKINMKKIPAEMSAKASKCETLRTHGVKWKRSEDELPLF